MDSEDDNNTEGTDKPFSSSYPWIQVSGHQGIFLPVGEGKVWKKSLDTDHNEAAIYRVLSNDDVMRPIVPNFYGEREFQGDHYIEIENVLKHFVNPAVMDIKMGVRTYAESEVTNDTKWREFYEKMIAIDPNEPTADEHRDRQTTKLRYMRFREDLSSSSNLGFRIDAMQLPTDKQSQKNLWRVKSPQQVNERLVEFFGGRRESRDRLIERLVFIRETLLSSLFFPTHELIGSSLLIAYDQKRTGVWLIDFCNTSSTTDGRRLDHLSDWRFGNREDGYLFGLNNLIQILLNHDVTTP